jgi:ATP-dependent Lhr-like helicase
LCSTGLVRFHPIVEEWFDRSFKAPTEAQQLAWDEIGGGGDVLISAPTGSGKTLAAFLSCLDQLVRAAADGSLLDETEVVYVSPLKALSNDIQKNLERPLEEIAKLAGEKGVLMPAIRAAVRTGDTPMWERQQMIKRPPHILVTTPESLFILLTADRSREFLKTTKTVIIDEIHAMADDKRGSHLSLSLVRLDDLVAKAGGKKPQRIGLSATVRPIDEVAKFVVPEKPVRIIDSGHRRKMDLQVEVPKDELGAVASNEMWGETYDRLAELILAHRTTLIFVNTRRHSERISHHLAERLGESAVLAHHGSLSRKLRLEAEQ